MTKTEIAVRSTAPAIVVQPSSYMEKYSHINSVAKARAEESHTLNQIGRKLGRGALASLIEREIKMLLELLNVKDMSDFQIRDAVQTLCSEYGHYKMSEVSYVFRQAKMRRMGDIYGKIDISDIGAWFDKYDREKIDCAYMEKSRADTKRIMETNYNDKKYVTRPRPIKDVAKQITKQKKND